MMNEHNKRQFYAVMQQNKVVGIVTRKGFAGYTTYSLCPSKFDLEEFLIFRTQNYQCDNIVGLKTSLWMAFYDYNTNMLFKAHGLSLSDQYWFAEIKLTELFFAIITRKIKSKKWEDVNFFQNDFKLGIGYYNQHINQMTERIKEDICFSPDYCTRGSAPKYWSIVDGERILTKFIENGNWYSIKNLQIVQQIIEALNECLVKFNRNSVDFVNYEFVKENMRLGNYICAKSKCFCSCDEEFIPFKCIHVDELSEEQLKKYDLENSKEYVELIKVLGFILSYSISMRHLGVVRNIKTNKMRLAPLFGIDEFGKENIELVVPEWLDKEILENLKRSLLRTMNNDSDERYQEKLQIVINNLDKMIQTIK